MDLRWVVVPGVFAAAACAANHEDGAAGRSSSRAEGADVTNVAAAACVKTTHIPLFAGSRFPQVMDFNARGELVGFAQSSDGNLQGFYWNGHELVDLGDAEPRAINDRSEIVLNVGNDSRAYVWREGRRTQIGDRAGIGAADINNAGQVVGSMSVPGGTDRSSHAFLWENGTLRDLGDFGFDRAGAQLINDQGTIIGYAAFVPESGGPPDGSSLFRWENGTSSITTIASRFLTANGLNAHGTAAFTAMPYDPPQSEGYLWQGGTNTQIQAFGSNSVGLSQISAVNDRGDAVGGAGLDYQGAGSFNEYRAFFWHDGTVATITAPDGKFFGPAALGNQGMTVGTEYVPGSAPEAFHPVAWQDGQSVYLDAENGNAVRVNSHGQIAGVVGVDVRIWDASACFGGNTGGDDDDSSGGDDDDSSTPPPDAGASSSSGGHAW